MDSNIFDRIYSGGGQGPAGVPGLPGGPAGPAPSRIDPKTLIRKLLASMRNAKPNPAMNRVPPAAPPGEASQVGALLSSLLSGGEANAAPAPAGPAKPGLPDVPGLNMGLPAGGPTPQSLAMLMQGGPADDPMAKPPVPMPKRFAQPVGGGEEIGPFETTVTPAEDGTTGEDVRTFLRSLSAGASSKSKPGRFFSGMSRALEAREGIKQRKTDTETASEDRRFKRQLQSSEEKRAQAKAEREAHESEVKVEKARAEIAKLIDPSLSIKDRVNLSAQATNHFGYLTKNAGLDPDEALGRTREWLKERQDYVLSGDVAGKAPPAEGTIAANKDGDKLIFQGGKWVPYTR